MTHNIDSKTADAAIVREMRGAIVDEAKKMTPEQRKKLIELLSAITNDKCEKAIYYV